MHRSVYQFAEHIVRNYVLDTWGPVLDVGSYNVNGCVRVLFNKSTEYVGLDMRSGPNVTLVSESWSMPLPDRKFSTVVCMEMLEHDEHPEWTMTEINRVTKAGGSLIVTARGPGYPLHEYPGDFHRFSPDHMGLLLIAAGFHPDILLADPEASGVMAYAHKIHDVTRIELAWEIPKVDLES